MVTQHATEASRRISIRLLIHRTGPNRQIAEPLMITELAIGTQVDAYVGPALPVLDELVE